MKLKIMKNKVSQSTIGALILVIFLILVAVYYFMVKTPTTQGGTTTTIRSQSLTDCGDIDGGCLSQESCAEGQSLQDCCVFAWNLLKKSGTCETGFKECKANECCCHPI